MKKENLFYLVIILAILIVRILVIIVPEVDIAFFGVVIHHFWWGIILMIMGFVISKQKTYPKILLYGIGAGLIIDQLVFIILGGGKDKEYWALPSLLGTIIILIFIYPLRTKLVTFLLRERAQK